MSEFVVKRVYDDPEVADGCRVLVDRLWPRGMSKQRAAIDLWAKDVTPSAELRSAYHHSQIGFDEFENRYRAELASSGAVPDLLKTLPAGRVTLLSAVKDEQHSHLPVLLAALRSAGADRDRDRSADGGASPAGR